MSPFSLGQSKDVKIGNDSGWVLEFYTASADGTIGAKPVASFSSSKYYASIDATLQDDLRGGSYSFTIQGLIDSDYGLISQAMPNHPVVAKLYLFWHDAISGPASYLGNLVGISSDLSPDDLQKAIVSVLYITKVKRTLGELSYDTEIHCVEWAYRAMSQLLTATLEADDYGKAAAEIATRTKVDITTYPEGGGRMTTDAAGTVGNEKVKYPIGKTYGSILRDIANAVETNLNKHGRGMLLVRDGKIYLGPRPYPLDGDPKDLTATAGFLEVSVDGSSDDDPTAPDPSGQAQKTHYTITLKGRPDIKPGDIVRFDPPKEDDSKTVPSLLSALAGAFAAPLLPTMSDSLSDSAVSMAVSSVKHRQGKAWGFYTEVKGVGLTDPTQPWDVYSDANAPGKNASPSADGGTEAAGAFKEQLQTWTANLQTIEVGQIRSFTSKTASDDVPSQTESLWEGLQSVDQNPNGTRRLPSNKKNPVRMDLPYATPFAWGKCGLVVPRYPGMRVVVAHRKGLEQEPIDVGAIWDSGKGPDSNPGDYWLSLPVGIDESKRDKATGDDAIAPYTGKASHDLIDADGNRVLEVGSLTVRVPKSGEETPAGTRPAMASDKGSITIEHAEGVAKIVMKQDGTILIKGKGITLDAGEGNIVLMGKTVDIQ
ncbi:hypothetical protein [Fimbriimonas ginsengisoli]|uniref:Uncharacterized protein n=1 Tax=Fimbriimonas ginsengisoli Gsoil 348 TaxID=661478 RepID=A0A068NSU0_FIMGI|nr:hypothetical protein [Fimbriimonas ginsengisoli]AIE86496.1 hypothetical protein OP10G_3128 [Fimbriimonas ginsengisoli Gsoil 348]